MKNLIMLFTLLVALGARAETTNAPPAQATNSFQTHAATPLPPTSVTFKGLKPNEIQSGGITYSGILVEAAKTRHPLQLLNPAAPPEYGSPEDNVTRGPIKHRVIGLKFFEIRF